MTHQKILNFISLIRDSHFTMTSIFMNGSCLNFFLILKSVFPTAEAYYNGSHVITKIGNKYYDINGEVKNTDKYLKGIAKDYGKKAVKQMLKYNYNG